MKISSNLFATFALVILAFQVNGAAAVTLQGVSGAVYVSHEVTNDVWVIDASDGKVIAQIPVGKKPIGLWPTADYKEVYVPNEGSDTVSIIDIASNKVVGEVKAGKRPHDSLVTPDGRFVYVTDFGENMVHVLQPGAAKVIKEITITSPGMESPGRAHALAFSPDGKEVWVTMHDANTIAVLDTATGNLVTTISGFGKVPQHTWFSNQGDKAYMTIGSRGGVIVFDAVTKKEVNFYKTGPSPTYVIQSPDGEAFYVTNTGGDTISIITTATGAVANVTVGPGPNHITLSPNGRYAYVTIGKANAVTVVEIARREMVAKFEAGKVPHGIVFVAAPDPKLVSLEKSYKELSVKVSGLQDELNNTKNTLYGAGGAAALFLITTAYFATRKPKAAKEEKK